VGEAVGRALVEALLSDPKPAGPTPEELARRRYDESEARFREANAKEDSRRLFRDLLGFSRRMREDLEARDVERSETLGGSFDVVRAPSSNFFGSGNNDVFLDDDGGGAGDTSVVDLGGLSPDSDATSAPLLLEDQGRAQALDAWQAQNAWGGQLPALAADSRYVPLADHIGQDVKNFSQDVVDEGAKRILKTFDVTGSQSLKGALTNFINKDWQEEMDPARLAWAVSNNDTRYLSSTEVPVGSLQRRIAGDPTLNYYSTRDLYAGDASAIPGAISRYAADTWHDFIDVPGRMRNEAIDQILHRVGLGE
jgi:hypothetical protein